MMLRLKVFCGKRRPLIPPRTYPQLPPSNLPNLLIGIARLLSWVAGGSAALLLVYYRFLLPKITKTSAARHSIKAHHLGLMRKLTASLVSLKDVQTQSFDVLPRPEPYKEPPQFSKLKSIADVLKQAEKHELEITDLSPITLLRCGISDLGKGKDGEAANPSTEDLFRYLEGHIPWLVSEEGLQFEQILWNTLSTNPSFTATPSPPTSAPMEEEIVPRQSTCWTYTTLTPLDPSPIHKSFAALSSALPSNATPRKA
ncbi:hypothetical protein BD779DRAFT_404698 [Infundibulicybe gibba]|nr:hypothetical protein BD779DRAFT_404698 [Infundibulicybe gibba]